MRSRSAADDRGSVAAEFAVALPAVALVLAVCLGGIGVGSQQVRLQDAAAGAARALARGDAGTAEVVIGGAAWHRWEREGLLCVRLSEAVRAPAVVGGWRLAAVSCALDGGR
jgi:hypothetical protein